ncbi:hypothetical protein [Vitiosangium sp. GDMCC 1.1324]|uniref:hypothetical protein n=1 Tax=Vitiosangium sp. (strain GDMCC 1.1324) TaxID=2138576 RepID=UPI0011B48CF0|nr:hypothetical protein [Vitiosangium sp. GDMCC 1.1324]
MLMNRMLAVAATLVLMLETGCPVGGDAGVLHQAMLKDQVEEMAHDGCPEEDIWAACGPRFNECMKDCRVAMEKRGWK